MKVNDLVLGKIINIKPYGLFLELEDGSRGLLHISEISNKYISNIYSRFYINQVLNVKIIKIDKEKNFINFTIKGITKEERSLYESKMNGFKK